MRMLHDAGTGVEHGSFARCAFVAHEIEELPRFLSGGSRGGTHMRGDPGAVELTLRA